MANIKPFMKCKISCSLWLILMYVKHCLLEVERSQKGHREVWVPPQLSSYLASICTHCQSPGQSLCPWILAWPALLCFQLYSPGHLCNAALPGISSVIDYQSLPLNALQIHGSPHLTLASCQGRHLHRATLIYLFSFLHINLLKTLPSPH